MNWEVVYLFNKKSFHSKIFAQKSLKVSIQQARFYQLQKMIVSLTDKLNNRKRKGETCQIRAKGDKLSIARFYLETRGGKRESWQPLSSPLRMLELALQLVGSLYTMGTEVFLKSHLPWAFLAGSADNVMTSCLKVMCLISESSLSFLCMIFRINHEFNMLQYLDIRSLKRANPLTTNHGKSPPSHFCR